MKAKKLLSLIMATFMVSTLLAGCASKTSPTNETTTKKENVTLTYSIWDQNQKAALDEIATEFHKKNANITVKVEVTPWGDYWTKMDTAASGGALADILWMNGPNFQKYASNDILAPISEKIDKDKFNMGDFNESLVSLYTYNDKIYGMPKDLDTIGLWYNKKMFTDAGIKFPDATWTWDTFSEAAKKLTDSSKGVWGFASTVENQTGYYNTILQNGGKVISEDGKKSGYDDPNTIAAMKFWTDMIKNKVSPNLKQMTDTDPRTLFTSGKVAMITDGSWGQKTYVENEFTKTNVDCAVLPKGKENATVIHGVASVISAKSKNQDAAWEFLKFMGSKQAAEILANKAGIIPAFNGTQDIWVKSNTSFNLQIFIDELAYAKPYPVSKNTPKWQEAETKFFTKAWSGSVTIEEACKQVALEMNKVLAEEN